MFGGIASVCKDLAENLAKKGVATTVFCGKSRDVSTEKLEESLEIVRMPCLDFPPRFVWFQLQNLRLFSQLLNEHDVIHVVNSQAGMVPAILAKKIRKPLVTSVHALPISEVQVFLKCPQSQWSIGDFAVNVLGYPLNQFLLDVCLRYSDHAVICSHTLLNEIEQVLGHVCPYSVIPNGVDFDGKWDVDNHNGESKFPTIVFYGRLYWRKGLVHLIRAVNALKVEFPRIRLLIFGKGPLENTLRRMTNELGLDQTILMMGHVARDKLLSAIKSADVIALPSLYEAQSVAVLEAMALAKPIVAFDLPSSSEVIRDQYNGLLAKAGDVTDLSQKISRLLRDEKLRRDLGRNALGYVREKHDWNKIVERYIALYEKQIASLPERGTP